MKLRKSLEIHQKMKKIKFITLSIVTLISFNCQSKDRENKVSKEVKVEYENSTEDIVDFEQYETAYFASGCFWCVEAVFESVKGVKEAVSGYSGGTQSNPTYEKVSSGRTGYAEAVKVYYDPKIISFQDLVIIFFGSHDPTTLNQQGPDEGPQYRSIAFYKTETEKKIIQDYIAKLTNDKVYKKPIITEVKKFDKFYDAEDYHQNYEKLNPNNSYVRNVSIPRLNKFKKKFPNYLK